MVAGLLYIPDVITDKEHDILVRWIDLQEWSNELKRRVQHYGYKYDYTAKKIDASMKVKPLSSILKGLFYWYSNDKILLPMPDQAIINEYQPGQGIAKHIDCQPCFKDIIVSLSLLSGIVMEFTSKDKKTVHELKLEPKSLLILHGEARNEWYHGIPARKSDHGIERKRRISVTFRSVILS